MTQSTQKLLATFALIGFGLSLIVHMTTFFGVDLMQSIPWIWILHIGVFPLFFLINPSWRGWHMSWEKLIGRAPLWAKTVFNIFFFYAILNFVIFIFLSKGYTPEINNGKYVLQSAGVVIKEITENEYHWQQAYVLRGFSGHWMAFYLIPALYFGYQRPSPK